MKMRGFTLIELMIVVAIIAIIAAIAIPNLLRSRMAANESAAIAACKTFAEAQDIFRRTDWNSNGVLEYAQAIKGDHSLFETTAGSNDIGLVDLAFANAEATGTDGTVPRLAPKQGYTFYVLTAQGSNAPGGSKSYLVTINSNPVMTVAYGLSAVPFSWDGTGRNSFLINSSGTVYQKDNQNSTHQSIYDPDTSWVVTE